MQHRVLFLAISVAIFTGCGQSPQKFVEENMEFAAVRLKAMDEALKDPARTPRTTESDGSVRTVPSRSWTSGFYPGCLWYMYQYTGDDGWESLAEKWTEPLAGEKDNVRTHDLGFMLYNSFGNGYRLTGNPEYRQILLDGANSLISRYHPVVGLIRSWDHGDWQYPVIIDNMMNLEFLFWATRETGDSIYWKVAVSHADSTLRNHFRDDWSAYHVVDYDTLSGMVTEKGTHQGYADGSAWARGQAWALYGYTMAYRETRDVQYLNAANHIADFILDHPRLPADMVPYWDFDAPGIPDDPRDASAAAIICSALFELCTYQDDGQRYYDSAVKVLNTLASAEYKAVHVPNGNFVLMHSTGNKPRDSEVDVPLIYADYYFIESLIRYRESL
jgi:rhamnogalacturonyl hydrolase YesR